MRGGAGLVLKEQPQRTEGRSKGRELVEDNPWGEAMGVRDVPECSAVEGDSHAVGHTIET